jgi:hypothetical protein
MNPINYATLKQAKKMKELSYPQDKTDFIWLYLGRSTKHNSSFSADYTLVQRCQVSFNEAEWYAAPNAQEIELDFSDNEVGGERFHPANKMTIDNAHCAQDRADAWIWEKEKTS